MKHLSPILLFLLPAGLSATKTLDIYWVDVEGGAATLIVTPAGESILIDTGNPGDRDASRIHKVEERPQLGGVVLDGRARQ